MYQYVSSDKIGYILNTITGEQIHKDQYGNKFEHKCEVGSELNRLMKIYDEQNPKYEILNISLIKKCQKYFKAFLDCGKEIKLIIDEKSKNLELKRHELNIVVAKDDETIIRCKCVDHAHHNKKFFKIL